MQPAKTAQRLFDVDEDQTSSSEKVSHINAYLIPGAPSICEQADREPISAIGEMSLAITRTLPLHLIISPRRGCANLLATGRSRAISSAAFMARRNSSTAFLDFAFGLRMTISQEAREPSEPSSKRIEAVRKVRLARRDKATVTNVAKASSTSAFGTCDQHERIIIAVRRRSSESRPVSPGWVLLTTHYA